MDCEAKRWKDGVFGWGGTPHYLPYLRQLLGGNCQYLHLPFVIYLRTHEVPHFVDFAWQTAYWARFQLWICKTPRKVECRDFCSLILKCHMCRMCLCVLYDNSRRNRGVFPNTHGIFKSSTQCGHDTGQEVWNQNQLVPSLMHTYRKPWH